MCLDLGLGPASTLQGRSLPQTIHRVTSSLLSPTPYGPRSKVEDYSLCHCKFRLDDSLPALLYRFSLFFLSLLHELHCCLAVGEDPAPCRCEEREPKQQERNIRLLLSLPLLCVLRCPFFMTITLVLSILLLVLSCGKYSWASITQHRTLDNIPAYLETVHTGYEDSFVGVIMIERTTWML